MERPKTLTIEESLKPSILATFSRLSFLLIFLLSTGSCYGTSSILFAPGKNPIVWNSGIADLFSRLLNTSGTVYSLAQARKAIPIRSR